MNNEESTRPQNGEASTVPCSAEPDYHSGKPPPINLKTNFLHF